ncbi:hypothetical protein TIFTF001_056468 [Ficus carica]|uniref:Uncharacterized protein n=1 Tax=Ficus carica TaxID=3494 RepID=A0AA88JK32_FICCA|nr:hypothetical protein TIFTF001_056468 [Ficus carica]
MCCEIPILPFCLIFLPLFYSLPPSLLVTVSAGDFITVAEPFTISMKANSLSSFALSLLSQRRQRNLHDLDDGDEKRPSGFSIAITVSAEKISLFLSLSRVQFSGFVVFFFKSIIFLLPGPLILVQWTTSGGEDSWVDGERQLSGFLRGLVCGFSSPRSFSICSDERRAWAASGGEQ